MKNEECRMKNVEPSGSAVRRALLMVFLLWGFAFALACRLLSLPDRNTLTNAEFTDKMLGGIRTEISGGLFEQADLVFHKGVGHHAPAGKFTDWFAGMRRQVAPHGHIHLHDEGILEIMPWLFFATRADSGNITAYAVAAYWLSGPAGRPELAEKVLNEALRNNPGDYRVYMEKGRLALKKGQYKKAARYMDAACSRLAGMPGADDDQQKFDRAEIMVYRGLLHEIQGSPENAARCYRETLRLFPGRLNLKERMVELEKGIRPSISPEKLAEALFFQYRHVCAEKEDD